MDGTMSRELIHKPRIGDTEKLTINLGVVDLGQIDLLVSEGFYSNRSDLIRTAIRNQLTIHADVVTQAVSRNSLTLGLRQISRSELEQLESRGESISLSVVGLARIAPDVSAALARATISSVNVLGAFDASPAVKDALADRTS